jgi:hypothetical protein
MLPLPPLSPSPEPVVGEAGIRGAVLQAVLKELDPDTSNLSQLVVQGGVLSQHLVGTGGVKPSGLRKPSSLKSREVRQRFAAYSLAEVCCLASPM